MRYRLHRDLVLRGIDLKIPRRSKLAFCGRTGCGKSSLFSVLPSESIESNLWAFIDVELLKARILLFVEKYDGHPRSVSTCCRDPSPPSNDAFFVLQDSGFRIEQSRNHEIWTCNL